MYNHLIFKANLIKNGVGAVEKNAHLEFDFFTPLILRHRSRLMPHLSRHWRLLRNGRNGTAKIGVDPQPF